MSKNQNKFFIRSLSLHASLVCDIRSSFYFASMASLQISTFLVTVSLSFSQHQQCCYVFQESKNPLPPADMAAIFEATKDMGLLLGKSGVYGTVSQMTPIHQRIKFG